MGHLVLAVFASEWRVGLLGVMVRNVVHWMLVAISVDYPEVVSILHPIHPDTLADVFFVHRLIFLV